VPISRLMDVLVLSISVEEAGKMQMKRALREINSDLFGIVGDFAYFCT